jgi:hypothetical protein
MDTNDIPNRASNMEKAEGDRWSSDPATVERRDRERVNSGASADEPGTGISNRSDTEERENQEAVPPRGDTKGGANAGSGNSSADKTEKKQV